MSIPSLKATYQETQGNLGLIALTTDLRTTKGLSTQKKDRLFTIFKNKELWAEEKTKSGHVKFVHKLSGKVVGWQAHGGSDLKPEQALSILNVVQEHLNLFCNDIFAYKDCNWKKEPDFEKSLKRFQAKAEQTSSLKKTLPELKEKTPKPVKSK